MDIRQFVERYGIALGVVIALVATLAILPGNAGDRVAGGNSATDIDLSAGGDATGAAGDASGDFSASGAGGTSGPSGTNVAAGGEQAAGGGTAGAGGQAAGAGGGGQAQSGGGAVKFGSGPDCDENGRQKGIAYSMPPCVEWSGGDNGGETFRGVTADQIKVVRWLGQLDPATEAILQGASLSDGRPKIAQTYEAIRRYQNNHFQTYGREIVYIDMEAGGPSENDEAMKADAQKIANEIKPFAVITGDPAAGIPNVLARELAQLGIICLCGGGSSEFYTELPPLLFGALPTSTEYAAHSAEYIAKKLWGKTAEFAGDEQIPTQSFKSQTRKFGLLYIEGARGKVDPEGKRARDAFVREFQKYGMKFEEEIAYIYDPGRNQTDVTNLIARFKAKGVTTIVPFWDPLYPILITQEATRQQYFPEWFIVGSGLSDTTAAGRLYDQAQWRHAFGISPLWVTWESVQTSSGYREYKHGDPNGELGEPGVLVNIYRAAAGTLFMGVHLAGPNLTNETFVRAVFSYPPTGGEPRAPLLYMTREFPTAIKDFVEVFYKADEQGPDERGQRGSGMIMKANGGRRYKLGEWTTDPSNGFNANGAIAISDDPNLGGDNFTHEQDGHRHDKRCLSCPD